MVTNLGSNKFLPRYIGPFKVLSKHGDAYKIDIPSRMKLHPVFYVGRLKPYYGIDDVASPENPDNNQDYQCTIQDRTYEFGVHASPKTRFDRNDRSNLDAVEIVLQLRNSGL